MIRYKDILHRIFVEPSGRAATASFLVCSVSGILLAVPYKVQQPADAISLILLDNPAAAFIRNIHFWSAQLFLILTLVHITEHFYRKTEYNLEKGIWLRLVFALPLIFFVMISGFILKGDADAASAYRILASLMEKIPLAGSLLRLTFLGNEGDLQLVYVHHIATATIMLAVIIYEHSRKVWPSATAFLVTLFIILLISFFFQPSFGEDSGKGPWYFLGLQEILAWSSNPGWTWLLLIFFLFLFWVIPGTGLKLNAALKILMILVFAGYLILTMIGAFFRGENWEWQWPMGPGRQQTRVISIHPVNFTLPEHLDYENVIPLIMGSREGCLVCHDKTAGFSPAHEPTAIGCWSCHGGNRYTLDKKQAHAGMDDIPGNLQNAGKNCGTVSCHPEIARRVPRSIMSTMSGVVAVDRYVFNESDSLSGYFHITEIGHSAADQHLRDLCANCHLGHPKQEAGQIDQLSRGGGCNACHLNYTKASLASMLKYRSDKTISSSDTFFHPSLSLDISDEHCFGCHSRSGRIATNYAGWHETLYDGDAIPGGINYRILQDKRVFEFAGDDVHHQKGLTCIDCHTSTELMGDGNLYSHKEDQVTVLCEDCHFTEPPGTIRYEDIDAEAKKIIAVRKWPVDGIDFVTGRQNGLAMVNVRTDEKGNGIQRLRSVDTIYQLKPPLDACFRKLAHRSLGCESCHTAWVPQCIGCHNAFDPLTAGHDMLGQKDKAGSWVEFVGKFMADPPVLGIITDPSGTRKVKTFTPGMILSIDTASYKSNRTASAPNIFQRLYAPISAHTTVRKSRSCRSCHLDPLAIGYGRGELVYEMSGSKGNFVFHPQFALNPYDQLPEDAWIGFLTENRGNASTRDNARPFSVEEQKKILTVGACLVCHDENSGIMQESLDDFPGLLKRLSVKCVLPVWQ